MNRASIRAVCSVMVGVGLGTPGCLGRGVGKSPEPARQQGGSVVHLVTDAGSSGTRMCLYEVHREGDLGPCHVGNREPVCGKSEGGLAALSAGQEPSRVSEILRPKLQEGWSALERAKGVEGSAPSPVAFLTFGAVLGTGGFRDPSTGQTMKTPAWDAAWSAVGQFFQDKGLSWVVAQAITGEEEARLGWEGVRQAFAPAHPFGTIDIGGATLEFAYGDPSKSELEVRAASVYTGQDATFHRYVNTEAFRVCFHPADVQLQSAKACERWMEDHVFGASPLRDVAQMAPISEVYATGAAWHGIFRNYPRTPEKGASAAWTLAQLRQLANKVCPMSEGQLEAFAPKAYPVVTKNGRACFDLSFAAAFLAAVTTGTDSARVLFGGEDAWARGASVSARYFNDCRP